MYLDYLIYFFRAHNEHGLHSPFVFELYLNFIKNPVENSIFQKIEDLRKQLNNDKSQIEVTDFGAGSKKANGNSRSIAEIAKNASKKAVLAKIIAGLAKSNDAQNILELGTSLGLTTAYMATTNNKAKIYSFEGCPNIAAIAKKNFDTLLLNNIEVIVGNIDKTLPENLSKVKKLDFGYIDANHKFEPTMRYFELLKSKIHEDSILIFDDIYWSSEMKAAWECIKKDEEVRCTIDLFYIGIVFFRKKMVKEHFTLKF